MIIPVCSCLGLLDDDVNGLQKRQVFCCLIDKAAAAFFVKTDGFIRGRKLIQILFLYQFIDPFLLLPNFPEGILCVRRFILVIWFLNHTCLVTALRFLLVDHLPPELYLPDLQKPQFRVRFQLLEVGFIVLPLDGHLFAASRNNIKIFEATPILDIVPDRLVFCLWGDFQPSDLLLHIQRSGQGLIGQLQTVLLGFLICPVIQIRLGRSRSCHFILSSLVSIVAFFCCRLRTLYLDGTDFLDLQMLAFNVISDLFEVGLEIPLRDGLLVPVHGNDIKFAKPISIQPLDVFQEGGVLSF